MICNRLVLSLFFLLFSFSSVFGSDGVDLGVYRTVNNDIVKVFQSRVPTLQFYLSNSIGLNLTSEQKSKISHLRNKVLKTKILDEAKIRVALIELGELLEQDPVELVAVNSKLETITKLQNGVAKSVVFSTLKAKNLLSPEQKKKIIELRRGMGVPPVTVRKPVAVLPVILEKNHITQQVKPSVPNGDILEKGPKAAPAELIIEKPAVSDTLEKDSKAAPAELLTEKPAVSDTLEEGHKAAPAELLTEKPAVSDTLEGDSKAAPAELIIEKPAVPGNNALGNTAKGSSLSKAGGKKKRSILEIYNSLISGQSKPFLSNKEAAEAIEKLQKSKEGKPLKKDDETLSPPKSPKTEGPKQSEPKLPGTEKKPNEKLPKVIKTHKALEGKKQKNKPQSLKAIRVISTKSKQTKEKALKKQKSKVVKEVPVDFMGIISTEDFLNSME